MSADPPHCPAAEAAGRPARGEGAVPLIDLVLSGALRLGTGLAEAARCEAAGPAGA